MSEWQTGLVMTNDEVSVFFVSLVTLLIAAHLGGAVAERFRLPRVIGEITGGLLLGRSVLGTIWPDAHEWLFHSFTGQEKLLSGIYWIGLALLMFISGDNVRGDGNGSDRRILVPVVIFAISLPMAAAWGVMGLLDLSALTGIRGGGISFQLVFAIAVAVTSIPVISRIFVDLGMIKTRFARVVLAASTFEDVVLWALLSVATALAGNAQADLQTILRTAMLSLIFLGLSLWLGEGVARVLRFLRLNSERFAAPALLLSVCFVFTALASLLNINVIFGALVAGMVVGRARGPGVRSVQKEISNISMAFFVPLYFALVGLRIGFTGTFDLTGALAFLVGSSLIKIFSVWLGAVIGGVASASALHLGIAMNTRGGPGIVLASVALEAAIISESFFTGLILAALLTSVISGLWMRRVVARQSELLVMAGEGQAGAGKHPS